MNCEVLGSYPAHNWIEVEVVDLDSDHVFFSTFNRQLVDGLLSAPVPQGVPRGVDVLRQIIDPDAELKREDGNRGRHFYNGVIKT